jgi:hypothetical protein
MSMATQPAAPANDENPLLSDSPITWDRLIESLDPPAMMVAISHRMSDRLRTRYAVEDIWQEILLCQIGLIFNGRICPNEFRCFPAWISINIATMVTFNNLGMATIARIGTPKSVYI